MNILPQDGRCKDTSHPLRRTLAADLHQLLLQKCISLCPAPPTHLTQCMGVEHGIQTSMAQGRSTKIISMIKWIRTSRLSIKNSLFEAGATATIASLTMDAVSNVTGPLQVFSERESSLLTTHWSEFTISS